MISHREACAYEELMQRPDLSPAGQWQGQFPAPVCHVEKAWEQKQEGRASLWLAVALFTNASSVCSKGN